MSQKESSLPGPTPQEEAAGEPAQEQEKPRETKLKRKATKYKLNQRALICQRLVLKTLARIQSGLLNRQPLVIVYVVKS